MTFSFPVIKQKSAEKYRGIKPAWLQSANVAKDYTMQAIFRDDSWNESADYVCLSVFLITPYVTDL